MIQMLRKLISLFSEVGQLLQYFRVLPLKKGVINLPQAAQCQSLIAYFTQKGENKQTWTYQKEHNI